MAAVGGIRGDAWWERPNPHDPVASPRAHDAHEAARVENPHAGCDPASKAYTVQTCDRCRRTLTVTPSDDFYCADGSPDHVCESCLADGLPVTEYRPVTIVDDAPVRQYGCAGRHHGNGTPDCPRSLHHHHDDRCQPPT